jgi:hypothetical protein
MVDFVTTLPISERLTGPLRAALAGEKGQWPSDLTDGEVAALVQHGVAPLAYASGPVPALRGEALRAAAAEPLRLRDLGEVLEALASRGVTALILKGTALAYDVYAEPEHRPRGDTDLLIAKDDLETTRSVLAELGYDERMTSGDEHGVRQAAFTRADAFGIEHVYDVHWSIANSAVFADALSFEELRPIARSLPRLGPHAAGLPHAYALLHACMHRIAHHQDSQRLIWLVDIALLRERMTWDEHARFWRLAAERGMVAVCRRSVEAADAWTKRQPHHTAEEFLTAEELTRKEASSAFLKDEITYGAVLRADLGALSWRARLTRLWQLAFPPAAFVQQRFGVQNRLALPWLYVRRGVRGVARLFRRVGSDQ